MNILNENKLAVLLSGSMWNNIKVLDETGSTNDYIKTGAEANSVVFARVQTAGRGRRGRTWISEAEGNIYMSVLLEPDFEPEKMPLIGFAAAVAIAETVEKCFGINCGIKWPNDIVAEGKKLCGILCEAVQKDGKYRCICGIGINLEKSPLDTEIPAISVKELCGREYDINEFAALLLKNIEFEYNNIDETIEKYRKYCVTTGKEIKIISDTEEIIAKAVGISENGNLIAGLDGKEISVNSGEVSVRGIYGYC